MAHVVGELALMTAMTTYFQSRMRAMDVKVDALITQVDQQAETIERLEGVLLRNLRARGPRPASGYPLRSQQGGKVQAQPGARLQSRPRQPARRAPIVKVVPVSQSSESEDSEEELPAQLPDTAAQILQMVAPVLQAVTAPITSSRDPAVKTIPGVSEDEDPVSDSEIGDELAELVPSKEDSNSS